MKKVLFWVNVAAVLVFAVDMGILGLKISDGSYDVMPCAFIGIICLSAIVIFGVCRAFEKCPHCNKTHLRSGEHCPYCGKKFTQEHTGVK